MESTQQVSIEAISFTVPSQIDVMFCEKDMQHQILNDVQSMTNEQFHKLLSEIDDLHDKVG